MACRFETPIPVWHSGRSCRCHRKPLREYRGIVNQFSLSIAPYRLERWNALNNKKRAPYVAKAAADRKRYEGEIQAQIQGQ
jgi:hypothetical protein